MSKKPVSVISQVDKPPKQRLKAPSSGIGSGTVAAVTWEDYVHTLLMESGNVARAAIHRTHDGLTLASTGDLSLDQEQVTAILRGFVDPGRLRVVGLRLGQDLRYTLTRVTDRRLMVGRDAATGNGCVLYKTNYCLIAAVYEDGNHPGGCYSLVSQLGDFLVESGF